MVFFRLNVDFILNPNSALQFLALLSRQTRAIPASQLLLPSFVTSSLRKLWSISMTLKFRMTKSGWIFKKPALTFLSKLVCICFSSPYSMFILFFRSQEASYYLWFSPWSLQGSWSHCNSYRVEGVQGDWLGNCLFNYEQTCVCIRWKVASWCRKIKEDWFQCRSALFWWEKVLLIHISV